ncbi:MAG: hypothetical protein CMC70_02465 [Flavobacteriaceae bacterium]|nr:hypothetical protein [Flavobacteriaceae bacterium]
MISEFDDFHSTIKIGENEKKQLFFASQSYGTNYFIYGYFKTKETTKNSSVITGLKMIVLNYKGILDLGFSTNENLKTTVSKVKEAGKDPMLLINITMQAAVSGTTKPEVDIDLDTPIKIEDRTNLKVVRDLIPISGDIDKNALNHGVFDDEFYYRDGWTYAERKVRDIADQGNDFPVRSVLDKEEESNLVGPAIRCRVAHFQLVFNP